MSTRPIRLLTMLTLAAGMLSLPAPAPGGPILDWLFGRPYYGVARTTYVLPYSAPGVVPTTAYFSGSSPCAMGPTACPTPVSAGTSMAAQTCCYTPTVAYRPLFPRLRALFAPRTTYRIVYSPACAPTVAYSPSTACAPAVGSSACAPCGPSVSYFGTSAPGATAYSGCSACAPPASTVQSYVGPGPAPETAPQTSTPGQQATPKTFQPPADDSEAGERLMPVPDSNTKFESMPVPSLTDPRNRTTWRTGHTVAYRPSEPRGQSARVVDVQWRPASR